MAKKKTTKRRGRKKATINITKIRQNVREETNALLKKQLAPVYRQVEKLTKQRDAIQGQLDKLQDVINELSGETPAAPKARKTSKRKVGRPAKKAGRPAKKTAAKSKSGVRGKNQQFIVTFVSKAKKKVRVSDIAAAARKKDMNVHLAIKALIEKGTLKTELPAGAKRNPYVSVG